MTSIKDSLFIVTGAASGIGQAVAIRAAAQGAHVRASDVNAEGLARTAATVRQAGGRLETSALDVSQADQIAAYARHVAETYPGQRIILLNNAGVALGAGTFEQNTLEEFAWLLEINLWGVVRMSKAFLPLLRAGGGHLVNVSSVFGLFGAPQNAAYSTAKFGVRGFTDVLRNELAGSAIRVSTVFPGGVKTNIAASARLGVSVTPEQHAKANRRFDKSARTTPEQAAVLILKGIEQNKARIIVGPDARVMDWLTRLLPVRYARLVLPGVRKAFSSK
ncbi:SDR family NAD(P)-dependent oxidoreductase [Hymenobacter baengnokdamensis]|uniref:SDR family NAD(P)-dependent oxidoreductase n=1 Tax=Hymenobacter baengnokdamensis TaxID=2615203 RepID=UPI0012465440|nr:SDR family NAD(P)-dependent oxidoreductase [Hymenobacter baengnokdamensis]